MALSDFQQFQKALENSKHILLVFSNKDNGDAVASALALRAYIEKQHKQADVVCSGFNISKNLRFLVGIKEIKPELAHLQKFIIKVDVSKAPIETLSYDVRDNWLSIYLTPKQGIITKQELRTAQSTFKYDLIITLSTADLESLGDIFLNNTDLFYKTPLINIDHQSNNEHYGHINLIDPTAASTAEIVYKFLQNNPSVINDTIATALLTGMTIATKSFKNPHITPETLQLASQLINHGAEREKIVQNLYRTKSIATLKLWGLALTHLQTDARHGLVWTTITHEDFTRSGATAEDLAGINEELISNSPEAKIIILLYENGTVEKKQINGIVATEKNHDALELTKLLNPHGTKKQSLFTLEKTSLKEAEEKVLAILRDRL